MKNLLFLISCVVSLYACQETKTIYIADHQVDCEGVAPQKCLLFKEKQNDEWTYFYDTIDGFDYEEGYNYQLEVSIKQIENPPADASSLQYSLVRIISKEKTKTIAQNIASTQNEPKSIVYNAFSRGYFITAEINKSAIKKFKDRNLQDFDSKKCNKKDWDNILSHIKKIDIKNISELKAPSEKRTFDGAAHAQLKIIVGDQTYTSSSFDHGNPPEEIKALVNTILSLAESIE
ncbi:DUF4377 domain-containing protein [Aquimarina sp. MMG016]|uniref:DUF4377 domain-containing protein n=1 Tax=Aquimarina sp. MMG016 TaxID=2822690 RepID=UPI001B3A4F6C|nr:DUF4377 domain-containing protein [Aquimarina sp. MMG016]MBQ4820006.1 DUF4377 domain-containing protein [Aquimarina sp. MMG016]